MGKNTATLKNLLKWKLLGNGPLASTGLETAAFIKTGKSAELNVPDV
eukprot:CAMPEP_0205825704 /NCGR_PEP_ID=MMETSP0206-20130828/26245_1 /ASSEMBLY_ACC=CAM_ASM_000279 /TAXON_ID=36767 /ORGANISM="Euplotes focardii, Strain TN1" /LENGTH=46 /DNA_ID= /DNA_START= /DNA_END= /DNA_ORIENTATION=